MQQDKESIKRMAELLRQGATLTDRSCPNCNSPLFRLRDATLWCAKDEKKVIVVKEGQEIPQEAQPQAPKASNAAYDKLEATLMAKIAHLEAKIEKTEDVDELQKLTVALSELLNSVDKIKRMKA
ncbi:MAG: Sjogren's syndrome/scleroderma autoantigen 1 family protein [Methanocella sp.]